jgi:hypothetical protein
MLAYYSLQIAYHLLRDAKPPVGSSPRCTPAHFLDSSLAELRRTPFARSSMSRARGRSHQISTTSTSGSSPRVAEKRTCRVLSVRTVDVNHGLADGSKLDPHIVIGDGAIDGVNHRRDPVLNTRPARRSKYDDCDASRTEVLLVP